jgi:tetratricopeptide (TPR) repeat protein
VTLTTPVPKFDVKNYEMGDQVQNRLSWAFAEASRYRTDPRQFALLLEHYRFNIESMVSSAAAAQVPLFLVTCPVNLKEWQPNVSRHRPDLSVEDRSRFLAAFRAGVLALERGDGAAAIAPLRDAVAIDGEYAEAHYRLGQALLRTGQRGDAKRELVRALERDGFPFRELPEFQEILRDVAARRSVPLVDLLPPLEAASGDGIPGYEVFTDYVHLTEQGQEIAAQEMLRALAAHGFLPGVSAAAVEGARIEIPDTFWPDREVYVSDANYHTAMLQHQYDRLDRFYDRAVEVCTRAPKEDPSFAAHCQERLHAFEAVEGAAVAYRSLVRAEKLGLLYQTYTPEQAQRIYEHYVDTIRWWTAASLTDEEFTKRVPRRFRPED